MIEAGLPPVADYEPEQRECETAAFERPPQKLAVSVELPTEFQAMLSGLASDGGKDSSGKHIKLWKIDGIRAIDFSRSEVGTTMVFDIDPGYDLDDVRSRLTDWLVDLRLRRERTERILARSALRT